MNNRPGTDDDRFARSWSERGHAIQDRVNQIRARSTSRNGEVGVTVDAQGRVLDVRIAPQALSLGNIRLAQALVEALQRAQVDAAQQLEDAWRPISSDPAVKNILDFGRQLAQPGPERSTAPDERRLTWEEQAHLNEQRIRRHFRG